MSAAAEGDRCLEPKASVGLSLYSTGVVKDPRQVTPAEFTTIEVLWDHPAKDLSVGHVHTVLSRQRQVAYTTVMTLLDKMHRKGSVRRSKKGKAYYYRPAVRRHEVLKYLLQQFANSYCHGHRDVLATFIRDRGAASQPLTHPPRTPQPTRGRDEMDIALL